MQQLRARIVDFDDIEARRDRLGRVVAASGGFDPVHPGHITYLQDAKTLGDTLVVIVNGDGFLRSKKGKPFQDLVTRCLIVAALRDVDLVVPFEVEGDQTVCEALARLKPDVFANGGDRADPTTIPEWEVCQRLGIELVTGVGADKHWSSSDMLRAWEAEP
jgi:D-beta-D-heptose 7-phosphate kinase/D-beta-D-heptose 1-phosphate adenosyltransferase